MSIGSVGRILAKVGPMGNTMANTQVGGTQFLELLNSETRDRLMRASRLSRYARGDFIIKEGEAGGGVYVLLSGHCDVLIGGEVVNHIGPNELFGEISALGGGTRTATVRTAADAEILEMSAADLRWVLEQDPAVMSALLTTLAHQTRRISDRETAVRDEHRELQAVERRLLPNPAVLDRSARFSMEARWQPLTYASGDYCDVMCLGPERYLLAVGDVMGHGAKTSLTLATVRGELRGLAERGLPPGQIIQQLDRHLARNGPRDIPITLAVCVLDGNDMTACCSNAGHPQPLICREAWVRTFSAVHGPLLGYGFGEEHAYHEDRVELAGGDSILFFTDGLSEARKGPDAPVDLLGVGGLSDMFQEICANRSTEKLATLFLAVEGFRRGYPAQDDATALLVHVR